MLEQHGTEAPSLVVVPHDESDLGLAHSGLVGPLRGAGCAAQRAISGQRRGAVVASHGNQLSVDDGYEAPTVLDSRRLRSE